MSLNSQEIIQETIKGYDQSAANFAARNYAKLPYQQLQQFLDLIPDGSQQLVDVGCGPGRDTLYLQTQGHTVTGTDLSFGMLAEAQKRAGSAGQFVQADMRSLPFKTATFQGAWMCASLLSLPKSEAGIALAETYRLLKSQGVLFVKVKFGVGEGWGYNHDNSRVYYSYYSPAELSKLVASSGFQVVTVDEGEENSVTNSSTDKSTRWVNLFARRSQA